MVSSSFTIAGHSPAELAALWAAMEFGHFTGMNGVTADFVPHFVAHFVAQGLELQCFAVNLQFFVTEHLTRTRSVPTKCATKCLEKGD